MAMRCHSITRPSEGSTRASESALLRKERAIAASSKARPSRSLAAPACHQCPTNGERHERHDEPGIPRSDNVYPHGSHARARGVSPISPRRQARKEAGGCRHAVPRAGDPRPPRRGNLLSGHAQLRPRSRRQEHSRAQRNAAPDCAAPADASAGPGVRHDAPAADARRDAPRRGRGNDAAARCRTSARRTPPRRARCGNDAPPFRARGAARGRHRDRHRAHVPGRDVGRFGPRRAGCISRWSRSDAAGAPARARCAESAA